MKKIVSATMLLWCLAGCNKHNQYPVEPGCNNSAVANNPYSKKDSLEKMLQRYTELGVPGVAVAIYSPEGYWGTTKGFARLETKKPMELCQLQYLQSISKIYMAVAILRLYEQGSIDLNAPITKYLPARYGKYLDKPGTIKVVNLLNHTSGIPEYTDDPVYIAYLLQHPDHSFTSEEFLEYIKDKPQQFVPGSRFAYTNTNYHLLALIADSVAGDHARLIQEQVLNPVRLKNTFYRNDRGYLHYPNLVNSYIDRNGNGAIEDISEMQKVSVASSKGDDGMVATPVDAVNFLKALMEGRLLSKTTMQRMMTWVNDENGQPIYGLGLYHINYAGQAGYGHGGARIGAGSGLYYFPGKNVYVFMGANIGTLIDGPIVRKVEELKVKLLELLLKD